MDFISQWTKGARAGRNPTLLLKRKKTDPGHGSPAAGCRLQAPGSQLGRGSLWSELGAGTAGSTTCHSPPSGCPQGHTAACNRTHNSSKNECKKGVCIQTGKQHAGPGGSGRASTDLPEGRGAGPAAGLQNRASTRRARCKHGCSARSPQGSKVGLQPLRRNRASGSAQDTP